MDDACYDQPMVGTSVDVFLEKDSYDLAMIQSLEKIYIDVPSLVKKKKKTTIDDFESIGKDAGSPGFINPVL